MKSTVLYDYLSFVHICHWVNVKHTLIDFLCSWSYFWMHLYASAAAIYHWCLTDALFFSHKQRRTGASFSRSCFLSFFEPCILPCWLCLFVCMMSMLCIPDPSHLMMIRWWLPTIHLLQLFAAYPWVYMIGKVHAHAHELWWRWAMHCVEASGPTFVKFFQWAATRKDIFPESFCLRFQKLQTGARTHSWQSTQATLTDAFGAWTCMYVGACVIYGTRIITLLMSLWLNLRLLARPWLGETAATQWDSGIRLHCTGGSYDNVKASHSDIHFDAFAQYYCIDLMLTCHIASLGVQRAADR